MAPALALNTAEPPQVLMHKRDQELPRARFVGPHHVGIGLTEAAREPGMVRERFVAWVAAVSETD